MPVISSLKVRVRVTAPLCEPPVLTWVEVRVAVGWVLSMTMFEPDVIAVIADEMALPAESE
jgi:hypothetical protein